MKRRDLVWDSQVLKLANNISSEVSKLLCPGNQINLGIAVLRKTYDCGINVEVLATLPRITFLVSGSNQSLVTELGNYIKYSARSLGTDSSLQIEVNPEEPCLDPLD
jgi:hypothetical protein